MGEPGSILDAALGAKHTGQCNINDKPQGSACASWQGRDGSKALCNPLKLRQLGMIRVSDRFLRLFLTRARIAVRMNATNSCPTAKQVGSAFANCPSGALNLFGIFGPAVTFSTLMRDEAKSIARGLQRRDPDLLDRLIEQYQYRLFRYLVYITGDKARAEDIFQETWLRVLERGHQYDGKSKFEAWLFAIARNLVIDWQRQKKGQSLDTLTDPEQGAPMEFADERDLSPLHLVLLNEQESNVRASLEQLPAA